MEVGIKVLEVADPTLQVRACMNFTSCVHVCTHVCLCVCAHMCMCVYTCVSMSVRMCVQESLESEAVLDVMEGEQTWPTEEELCEAEGEGGETEGG